MIGLSIVTISRQIGSLGDEIAASLSRKLDMELIVRDRIINEWLPENTNDYVRRMLAESPKFFLNQMEDGVSFKEYIEQRLIAFAQHTPAIIIGMGAQVIFSSHQDATNIRIIASFQTRINRLKKQFGIGDTEAESILFKTDKKHKRYIATLYGVDWADPTLYDLTVNTDAVGADECVELVCSMVKERVRLRPENQTETDISKNEIQNCVFRHPAESEFAKILDMYNIDWKYEPKTFPVEWDAEGNVTMAFSPDFYLPKFDTYIEITTMNQKYVTIKNKKVRKLRELYPGINVKIVYKKDFHALLRRFGDVIGSE